MNRFATMSLAGLLALPAIGCAQDRNEAAAASKGAEKAAREFSRADSRPEKPEGRTSRAPRRLESVTWNSVKHELTWVISKGERKEGTNFEPTGQDSYEINMDAATMTFNGESRRFSREEAKNVHMLMDLVSKYAVDSTIWWDQGQGDPVDGSKPGRPVEERPSDRLNDTKGKVLRVSAERDLTMKELDTQVREMEERLAELKRLQQLERARIRSTSH